MGWDSGEWCSNPQLATEIHLNILKYLTYLDSPIRATMSWFWLHSTHALYRCLIQNWLNDRCNFITTANVLHKAKHWVEYKSVLGDCNCSQMLLQNTVCMRATKQVVFKFCWPSVMCPGAQSYAQPRPRIYKHAMNSWQFPPNNECDFHFILYNNEPAPTSDCWCWQLSMPIHQKKLKRSHREI